MKNAMQLKAVVRNIAKEKKISAILVLQNYMMERFLERVSLSAYRDHFIIKGGFLIASMVGLDTRATKDMDATVKEYPVNAASVREMIEEILRVPVDDGISFSLGGIGEIREGDEYAGFRVALTAGYEGMAVPIKVDMTTGDRITPKEIEYEYRLMLEDRSIRVLAYNLPTVLAEKLETVVSRGDQNTRPRDYYDIWILTRLRTEDPDPGLLGEALRSTAAMRGSAAVLERYREIMHTVRHSEAMIRRWNDYRKDFDYAAGIGFDDVCDAVIAVMDRLRDQKKTEESKETDP